jgi:hypothetical protein
MELSYWIASITSPPENIRIQDPGVSGEPTAEMLDRGEKLAATTYDLARNTTSLQSALLSRCRFERGALMTNTARLKPSGGKDTYRRHRQVVDCNEIRKYTRKATSLLSGMVHGELLGSSTNGTGVSVGESSTHV